MKNQGMRIIGLCLSLLVSWPNAVSADAVVLWNENAAKAATAACLHISGNGLAEARMYAMVHVAIHDAVNAIDRRSRPYAFDAEASGPVSLDAAVAAAARDVLVSVISGLPESPECIANGIAHTEGLICCRARGDTEWTCKDKRYGIGASSRRHNRRAAGRRWIRCAVGGFQLSARDRTG